MAFCAHQQWLRMHQDENGFTLQYSNRLGNIANSLPRPAKQRPSLIFFFGKQLKSRAMRSLFPGTKIHNCRRFGIANICIDPTSTDDDYPILLADSCVDHAQTNLRGKASCHETENYPVAWLNDNDRQATQQDLIDCLFSRLLLTFVDVLCIFAQDCGGLDAVAERLASWIAIGSASSLPSTIRPRLLIVSNVPGDAFNSEVLSFRLKVMADPKFSASFSSLNIVNILGSRLSSRETFSGLGSIIQDEARTARFERTNHYTLFSFTHVAAFFEMALRNFATSPQETFNFVKSSREGNPVSPNFQHHLKSFIALCSPKKIPANTLWDFIASAIVLDSFPLDMHLFNPSSVFHTLYRHACLCGVHDFSVLEQLSKDQVCAEIEAQVISLFSEMKFESQSAAALRLRCLKRNSQYFQQLKSNVDCLICLQRKPEHIMSCGHSICDMCIRIRTFSQPSKGKEYYYELNACPQCQAAINFEARVLPPTCRVRLVAFDGGGSRGIVSLGFIEELRQTLGLRYPIQENFDYCIGTSSGGLATIGLFGKNWSPKQCLAFFHRFAKIIFPPKMSMRFSLYAIIKRIFAFFAEDGKYNASILEEALKESLGLSPLFGPKLSRPSGIRFAVTATTISDATLCLISNYNGEGQSNNESRYKHLRANQADEEILLWEAARCTTAALSYFKPKHLTVFGTFQDGGLKYNNPVRPGLREVQRIWENSDCDLVLSIGTGFEKKPLSPVASNVRNFFQDGAMARFYRAAMDSLSLNGQMSWEDHWFGLEEDVKKQQFRLNLPLVGKEPDIDDVDKMQYLYDQIRYHLGDIEGIARAFKAVTFFFELHEPPAYEKTRYCCRGSILSRSPDSRDLVQSLGNYYPHAQFFYNDLSLGFLNANDVCELCGRFQKAVMFYVRHPSDRVNVQLVFNRLFRRSISGFPQPIQWFVERQKLSAKFGQSNHESRLEFSEESACRCERERCGQPSPVNNKRSLETRSTRNRKRRRL